MTLPAPLQKNLEKLIDRATSEEMTKPDLELYQEVCNAINSRNEMPREAIRLLTRKISSGKPKVQFLALELIEATTCGCELPYHTQLGQKDFLRLLSMLLQRDPVEPVKVKLLYLFQFWSEFFDSHKDLLPQFQELYQGLRKKGIGFPAPQATKYNSLKKSGGHSTSSHRSSDHHHRSEPQPSVPQDPTKLAKFRQELELVKENLQTANEMIDAANPKDDVRRNDVLIDLMKALKEVEEKLKKAIAELNDEVTLQVCLDLNDDLNQTLERFDALKKNKKPAPFFRARDFIEKEREEAKKPGYNNPPPKSGGGGGFMDFDGFGGGGSRSPAEKPAPKPASAGLVDLLGESEPVTTNVPNRGGGGADFLGGAPMMPAQPPQPKSNPSDLLGLNLNAAQPPVMQPMVPQQPVQQQKPDIFSVLPGVQPQPQYPNQGMMQPGMQQGLQQSAFRQQQMQGYPQGGMMQPGMNPGMMGMNPGMMQQGMNPGMMGMNPAMMQQGMNPGMMGMNPGMMGMNPMSPGLGGGVMSPGLAQNRGPAPATQSQFGKPAGGGIRMDNGPAFPNQQSQQTKNTVASPFDDIVDNIVTTEMTKKDVKPPAPVMQQQQPPKQANFDDLI